MVQDKPKASVSEPVVKGLPRNKYDDQNPVDSKLHLFLTVLVIMKDYQISDAGKIKDNHWYEVYFDLE